MTGRIYPYGALKENNRVYLTTIYYGKYYILSRDYTEDTVVMKRVYINEDESWDLNTVSTNTAIPFTLSTNADGVHFKYGSKVLVPNETNVISLGDYEQDKDLFVFQSKYETIPSSLMMSGVSYYVKTNNDVPVLFNLYNDGVKEPVNIRIIPVPVIFYHRSMVVNDMRLVLSMVYGSYVPKVWYENHVIDRKGYTCISTINDVNYTIKGNNSVVLEQTNTTPTPAPVIPQKSVFSETWFIVLVILIAIILVSLFIYFFIVGRHSNHHYHSYNTYDRYYRY